MTNKTGVNDLRELFLRFFESKEHLRLPSFSLIPQNDQSLLLINSGMAPMKPWFKGEEEPPRRRVCTCQKCIRTGDIENIGHTARHGTYFEMLGNFSFGDYFKHDAIHWAWEFLTSPEWVGLDPDRLSNGLMWYGCPEKLSFSVSYAYRMLPMLMEEFQNVLLSYRLRGNAPDSSTMTGKVRYLIYQVKVIIHAFYPLMLNTAKRSRTTVEALEIKGYRYAAVNKEVKKMKLSTLKVTCDDLLFLAVSFLWVALVVLGSLLIG